MSTCKILSIVGLGLALGLSLAAGGGLAAPAASGYEVYSVQEGDTLAAIAQRFGVTESRLVELNGLTPDTQLTRGQSLTVPLGSGTDAERQAQHRFAAEEREASDVEATKLTISPAAQTRSGPVVGYLGIASQNTSAVVDPRRPKHLCDIERGTNLCVSRQYGDYYGILMVDGAIAWVPKQNVALHPVELVAGVEVPAGVNGRANIIETAFRYYGVPYLYGGSLPGPTDCSAFIQTVFRQCGIPLPRTAAAQFNTGYIVPPDQLLVGDRVYFYNSDGSIGHAGIYIGNGQFIHASSRRGYVGIDTLRSGFYRNRLAGVRRP